MKNIFHKNFLWGASTSSHQIEGGLTNNWTKWEEERLSKLSKEQLKRGRDNYLSNSKYSCESFKNYQEDIKVLKELGLNAYRFSIEWSRIEPTKGVFNKQGLQYYEELVKELRKNGIEPVVTLWHWTIPLWLEQEGGVMSKKFSQYFQKMTEKVLESISKDVIYWITINEPEVFSTMSYLKGQWPPNKKNVLQFLKLYLFTFPKVHKEVYMLIKGKNPKSKISFAKNNQCIRSYNNKIWNKVVAKVFKWFTNYLQIELVKKYMDYIALNYYFQTHMGIRGIENGNERVSDLGWWFKPKGIEGVIKDLYCRFNLPILITENGIADSSDRNRREWIEKTIGSISECIREDVNLIGYLHWSLLDNFEWAEGFWPKFGLVSIDSDTKRRVVKDSGVFYSKIVRKNGIM
jgi:beta-glucosidase